MVELRTKKREIKGDGTNHHDMPKFKRIPFVSEFTISDTAGTSPNPASNYIDTTSS